MIRFLLCSALLLGGCDALADRATDRARDAGAAAVARAFDSTGADPARPNLQGRGRAIDGDTVSMDFRLSGVDAYERKQMCARDNACWPCGKIAQDFAAKALRDRPATIELVGGATYGRPVAIVTVDGEDLGEMMIRAGLAVPAPRYLKSDPARARRYEDAARTARRERRGAYAGDWIEPASWRRGQRLECET
ncbi:thermonuclease family protein [Sphingomonas sanxanigenens]|uniref:TNase-like domain-containing protein n=1 Tax=Sphingomonas sanxanigenens DSM 19645 = NX02 TaxID=1123269 RepID=A0A0F7JW67_9SPHN|nr:thermonuclease family protein [Sphingomonas sanxanigenens]AKH18975.1 hypothetical protein NX02_p1670 [Sphingomonas sanxanigenens DSM 19645 = NX02]